MGKVPLPVVKEFELQARQNLCTLNFSDAFTKTASGRPAGRLPSYPHPPKLKEVPTILQRFSGVPVHLPPFRPSHGPSSLYNECKESEADCPQKGSQTSPISGRLADQGPIPGGGTREHSDHDRPDTVLRVDNQSREVRTETHSFFSFVGYEYHLDSALVEPTEKRWLKNFRI